MTMPEQRRPDPPPLIAQDSGRSFCDSGDLMSVGF
jgi:hypothetical protein